MHIVRQAVGPQTQGSHLSVLAGEQTPLPLQVRALVAEPFLHDAGSPHDVPDATCWQLLSAAQLPGFPHSPLGAHMPLGSGLPVPTNVQVPAWPLTLQDWHWPQDVPVVLQQTPSTQ